MPRKPKSLSPPPLTACALEVEFDSLLGRARKDGVITSTQAYRLSDLLQREIGARIDTELRLAEAERDRRAEAHLASLPPAQRRRAQLMLVAQKQSDATV